MLGRELDLLENNVFAALTVLRGDIEISRYFYSFRTGTTTTTTGSDPKTERDPYPLWQHGIRPWCLGNEIQPSLLARVVALQGKPGSHSEDMARLHVKVSTITAMEDQ